MRSLKEKAYYSKDSEKTHLWVHLLLTANWSDREEILGGKPIICKAGQFTTGRKQLSKETGINESKIERMLTYFEKIEQQIEQRKTNTNRLISILNWDKYQSSEQQVEQRVNNHRTTSEQRVNTSKESKEIQEVKEDNRDAAKAATLKRISDFKESLYPYTKSKGGSFENKTVKEFFDYWSELNKSGTKMRWEIQQTFEISKRLANWIKNENKFNKYGKEEDDHVH